MSTQHSVANMQLTGPLVSYYTKILRTLTFEASKARAEKTKSFLATSPVKLFASLWSGGGAGTPDSVMSTKQPLQPSLHRTNSFHSFQGSIRGRDDPSFVEDDIPDNPLMRLEQTFSIYTKALLARKGTIVSKHILSRHLADELAVNDLYNRLVENPYDAEISPNVTIEVMFVAFENFLRIAWTSQMGPVMSMQSLDTLQDRANRRAPGDFADFVHYLFADMAPQNRRAFARIIKLLAQLLDGCDNDGDRGALTLMFAELLVTNGCASLYINLLDRLVEDCDRIFHESPAQGYEFSNSVAGSVHSTLRKQNSLAGSVTSNTSSLRKRFGLDVFKRPKEDKPSVWRSLSRHRNPATGEVSSLSKASGRYMDDNSLLRTGHGPGTPNRRPPILGAFDDSRPGSSHRSDYTADSMSGRVEGLGVRSPKKKRRSSLSDLKMLMEAATLEDEEPPQPLATTRQTSGKLNAASPAKDQVVHSSFQVPRQQENMRSSPASEQNLGSPTKTHSKHVKAFSVSTIPTLYATQSDITNDSTDRKSRSPTRSPQKLRLNSPQKLRERIASDQLAIESTGKNMQTVLSNISEEVTKLHDNSAASEIQALTDSVRALEIQVPKLFQELQERQTALQKEMDATVKTTETKVRAIDQLHKEVTAENELLYEKFNGELGRILRALKGKGKDEKEEMMTKLKEQADETARMKKENAKLKREIVSLRAALRSEHGL